MFTTPQEDFWAGEFGDEYSSRNTEKQYLSSNIAMFTRILSRTRDIDSVVEFGANIGLNLLAIRTLLPDVATTAIEINQFAAKQLREKLPNAEVINNSILDVELSSQFDLVLIKGVLIHINPEALETVYKKLAAASRRYVIIAEYYNPTPVSISYRGHEDRLFKRDFAGEFLDQNRCFDVVDYGFIWRRDPNFPQDDTNWFLLERKP